MKAQIEGMGFDVSDLQKVTETNPLTNVVESFYLVERDIKIPESRFNELLPVNVFHTGVEGEQYSTNNLVSPINRTITICGLSGYGGGFDLDQTMRDALEEAIDEYSALSIGLSFTLTFASDYQNYDITVYRSGNYAGGSAGFPYNNGNPYNFAVIGGGTSSYGVNVTKHVIKHEIGHCLGLRHTDYFDRSISCGGTPSNEGSAGVGANYIPGTATGADLNSLMLSCFGISSTGAFSADDVDAFEYLY